MGTGNKYDIQEPQVKSFPLGASTPREAGVLQMQANSQTQNANNQALAGGRKNKRGGSIAIATPPVLYNETNAGGSGVTSQTQANVAASVQNQENKSMDAGAFKKGGKRRNKSRKSGKRKSKRRRTRKYRK